MPLFTDHQIRRLARFLREDHGCQLTDDQLLEQIHLLLEDIAGFESSSDPSTQSTIDHIRSAYHDAKNDQ